MAETNKELNYTEADRVDNPDTYILSPEGLDSFKNNNPTEPRGPHILASSDFPVGDSEERPPAPETTERAAPDWRKEWTTRKPSDVIQDIPKYPASEDPQAEEKYKKSINELDDVDAHGRRVGAYRESYHMAERVKVGESVKRYEQELLAGKELTDEEKDFVLDRKLKTNQRYQESKSSYEKKGLSEKDINLLLQTNFKQDIDEALSSMQDENGKFNSRKLGLEELLALKGKYKKEITREFFQDRKARQEESEDRFRQKKEEEFLAENPGWTPEEARRQQELELMRRERDIYRSAMQNADNQGTTDDEDLPVADPDTTSTDTDSEDEENQSEDDQDTPEADDTDTTTEDTDDSSAADADTDNPDTPPAVETPDTPDTSTPETTNPVSTERDIRNRRRLALVAGVVTGAVAGLAGGVAVAATAATVASIGGLASGLTRFVAVKLRDSYSREINQTTDPVLRAKLEKRRDIADKVARAAVYVRDFFVGGTIGAVASGLISQAFMGGQGLVSSLGAENAAPASTGGPESASGDTGSPEGTLGAQDGASPKDIGGADSISTQTEGVLVKDGRVDLEGSAWNGNLAGEHAGSLRGDALNQSNYTGGIHEMAPRMLENDLISSGITREQLLDNLGTGGTHDLLNAYVNQIRNGTFDPNLSDILQNTNTDGAKKLLEMIK